MSNFNDSDLVGMVAPTQVKRAVNANKSVLKPIDF